LSANVVIVHDEPAFVDQAAAALQHAGFSAVAFADPMVALDRIGSGQPIDVLVTRVTFPQGKPNGLSLALVLRVKHPLLKVVFAARTGQIEHTEGVGELVPHPVDLEKLVEAVERAARGRLSVAWRGSHAGPGPAVIRHEDSAETSRLREDNHNATKPGFVE
jgi:DNA-binding NtrC family response regulator